MQDLGEDPNAPDAIKKDWQTTLDYLGVKSGDEIGVEQHEKWAVDAMLEAWERFGVRNASSARARVKVDRP